MEIGYMGDIQDRELISQITSFLGIKHIAVEKSISQLKEIENMSNLTLISRHTLKEGYDINNKNFKSKLNQIRFNYQYISVIANSADLLSRLVVDTRVDAFHINENSQIKFFNKKFCNRMEENNKLAEINLEGLYSNQISKNLKQILRIVELFNKSKVNYVISHFPKTEVELRSQKGIRALAEICGVASNKINNIHFLKRIELNNKKLAGVIPFEGVEII
ncbi:MAG: RNase P subunit p30 family protein [Candidatus Heimdallarchaeota archaeon]|nr:RNase P subunit p30 family protein [Candidatus Heimdallarchaeota archaeon]MDH5645874.1 RNase P subunit p30 family protein [Candidatus Heimdallarchaeota archaeon]